MDTERAIAAALACAGSLAAVRSSIATLMEPPGGHHAALPETKPGLTAGAAGAPLRAIPTKPPTAASTVDGTAAPQSHHVGRFGEEASSSGASSPREPPHVVERGGPARAGTTEPAPPAPPAPPADRDPTPDRAVSRRTMTRRFVASALESYWIESERCGRELSAEATSWLRRREAGQLAGEMRGENGVGGQHWSAVDADSGRGGSDAGAGGSFMEERCASPEEFEATRAKLLNEISSMSDAAGSPTATEPAHLNPQREPAPDLCTDALDHIFCALDESSLAMAGQVSRSWWAAARGATCWAALGARRWAAPAPAAAYPPALLGWSASRFGAEPSEWEAIQRIRENAEADAAPTDSSRAYRAFVWGARRVRPARRRLAELRHAVGCAHSLLRQLEARTSSPNAAAIADGSSQIEALEKEVECASQEIKRLRGTGPSASDGASSERFKLVPAGETNPTGRWFRVTLQGRRIQAYPGSSTLS